MQFCGRHTIVITMYPMQYTFAAKIVTILFCCCSVVVFVLLTYSSPIFPFILPIYLSRHDAAFIVFNRVTDGRMPCCRAAVSPCCRVLNGDRIHAPLNLSLAYIFRQWRSRKRAKTCEWFTSEKSIHENKTETTTPTKAEERQKEWERKREKGIKMN